MVEGSNEASRRHWVRWLTLGGSVSFLALVGPSCTYDKNKPCGDDLVVMKNADGEPRCVCPPGSINSPTGCVECGENQIVQGAQCVCDEGYTMGADGTCVEMMGSGGATSTGTDTNTVTGTGTGTSTNTGTCTGTSTTGSSGAAGAGGEGGESGDGGETTTTDGTTTTGDATTTTSTTGSAPECVVNDDCPVPAAPGDPAQICDAGVCRPPTGWGKPCTPDGGECAGLEADFCDSFQMGCTVSNCSNVPDTCPAGYDCCDLSAYPGFAIMCIPAGPYCGNPAP